MDGSHKKGLNIMISNNLTKSGTSIVGQGLSIDILNVLLKSLIIEIAITASFKQPAFLQWQLNGHCMEHTR